MEINDCEVYLMNNAILMAVGEFKAKIIIACPNKDVMDKVESYLNRARQLENKNQSLHDQITQMENERLTIDKHAKTAADKIAILRAAL